jgi:hypothetical protein
MFLNSTSIYMNFISYRVGVHKLYRNIGNNCMRQKGDVKPVLY